MEDKLKQCVDDLSFLLQGELIVGDQETLSVYGRIEQQQFSELTKNISRLYLQQEYDMGFTINRILAELEKFNIPKPQKSWNPFSKNKKIPRSVLLGYYNSTIRFTEQLQVELKLQEVQILKELTLLEKIEIQSEQCCENLQRCLSRGKNALNLLEEECVSSDQKQEDLMLWKNRLIQKIEDINISVTASGQTTAQVKLLRQNDKKIIERIKNLILKTIPFWKKQMAIFLEAAKFSDENHANQILSDELELLSEIENMDLQIRNELNEIYQ